jgi:hypothetical protein
VGWRCRRIWILMTLWRKARQSSLMHS